MYTDFANEYLVPKWIDSFAKSVYFDDSEEGKYKNTSLSFPQPFEQLHRNIKDNLHIYIIVCIDN